MSGTSLNNFRLIKAGIDVQALFAEIEEEALWTTSRSKHVHEHRETISFHLTLAVPMPGVAYKNIRKHAPTVWWNRVPSITSWLEAYCRGVERPLAQAMIARLNPSGRIYPHADAGDFYRGRDRHHLVLSSPSGCQFRCGDEQIIMREGELWWFNNSLVHQVVNLSPDRSRTHLVFDLSQGRSLDAFPWSRAQRGASLATPMPLASPSVMARRWLTGEPVPPLHHFLPRFSGRSSQSNDGRTGGSMALGIAAQRQSYIDTFSLAIPCAEAVQALAAMSPLLEIEAGTGFWSRLVSREGADVMAVVSDPAARSGVHGRYFPTENATGEEAVGRNPERNVLMVWPDLARSWPSLVAKALRPGRQLALISEGKDGRTGRAEFFGALHTEFRLVQSVVIPVFPGLGDRLEIWQKLDPALAAA
jgi:hypothetical protein